MPPSTSIVVPVIDAAAGEQSQPPVPAISAGSVMWSCGMPAHGRDAGQRLAGHHRGGGEVVVDDPVPLGRVGRVVAVCPVQHDHLVAVGPEPVGARGPDAARAVHDQCCSTHGRFLARGTRALTGYWYFALCRLTSRPAASRTTYPVTRVLRPPMGHPRPAVVGDVDGHHLGGPRGGAPRTD